MLKSASDAPGPKSALRGTKSVTFTKAILQVFNLHKIAMNPIGDPSVLLIQSSEILSESSKGISVLPFPRPIYRWDQAEVWEEFGIGGWCIRTDLEIYGSTIGVWKLHEIDDDHDDHEHDHDHDDHDDDYKTMHNDTISWKIHTPMVEP